MLLVKYGEIALKSPSVRKRFERQLVNNIKSSLIDKRIEAAIDVGRGVISIRTSSTEEVEEVLSRTFGVIYYSKCVETTSKKEDIERETMKMAASLSPDSTFSVRCKRTGVHPYTSMELAARLGEVVLEAYPEKNLGVDLGSPDHALNVEVRGSKCHLYIEKKRGPGGMPVGTQGRALLYVPNNMEEEAAVAGWLALKRGVSLHILSEETEVMRLLIPWGGPRRVVEAESIEEALAVKNSRALVLPYRKIPEDIPSTAGYAAFLYPIIGLPENIYASVLDRISSTAPV